MLQPFQFTRILELHSGLHVGGSTQDLNPHRSFADSAAAGSPELGFEFRHSTMGHGNSHQWLHYKANRKDFPLKLCKIQYLYKTYHFSSLKVPVPQLSGIIYYYVDATTNLKLYPLNNNFSMTWQSPGYWTFLIVIPLGISGSRILGYLSFAVVLLYLAQHLYGPPML